MRKVRFDNHSSGKIDLMGHPRISIPGHAFGDNAVVRSDIPDDAKTENMLKSLPSRYPALAVTFLDSEEASASSGSEGGGEGLGDGDKNPSAVKLTMEEFSAQAKAEEKGAGWWEFTLEGLEAPIKVRVTKDSKSAVEMAYAIYSGKE